MFNRFDKKRDKQLGIKTTGYRDWVGKGARYYNRTESTPYNSLDRLFVLYTLPQNPVLVDFGAGKGRSSLYVHDRFNIPVRAIELNEITFEELEENKINYLKKKNLKHADIKLYLQFAEYYEIEPEENIFYFFNPFTLAIFKEVIDNIQESVITHPRQVDIILHYPARNFIRYMKDRTKFNRIKTINVLNSDDPRDIFVIYRNEFKG